MGRVCAHVSHLCDRAHRKTMQNKHACRKKTELVKAGDAPAPLQRPRCRAARAQRVTCALAPASRRLRQRSAPQIVQQPMGARHQARVPHCQGMHPDLERCCRRGAGAAPGENWGEVSSLSGRTCSLRVSCFPCHSDSSLEGVSWSRAPRASSPMYHRHCLTPRPLKCARVLCALQRAKGVVCCWPYSSRGPADRAPIDQILYYECVFVSL